MECIPVSGEREGCWNSWLMVVQRGLVCLPIKSPGGDGKQAIRYAFVDFRSPA